MEKLCFKCETQKPISEFYAHPRMADKHLNKCKACTKNDVHGNYEERRVAKADYERERNQRPERKSKKLLYQKLARQRHPDKARCYNMVRRALATGKLERLPCQFCGDPNAQAHHEDYSKPLDVVWCCFRCHREKMHGQKVTAGSDSAPWSARSVCLWGFLVISSNGGNKTWPGLLVFRMQGLCQRFI